MIHKLCIKCLHSCKQENTVKIIKCPRFQKRLSDDEFMDIINDLGNVENEADELKKRARKLVQNTLSENNEAASHNDDTSDINNIISDDDIV
ncbi:hypothetical protein ACFL1R_11795 [Candidatus Latescibacterota bacterium]